VLNQGTYKGMIIGVDLGEASTGTPQIEVYVELSAQITEEGNSYVFDSRTVYLPVTDQTIGDSDNIGWVLKVLKHIGWSGKSFQDFDGIEGREITLYCKHEENQEGMEREKWSINVPRSQSLTSMNKKDRRSLDAKFKSALKWVQSDQTKTKAKKPTDKPKAIEEDVPVNLTPEDGEEIPF